MTEEDNTAEIHAQQAILKLRDSGYAEHAATIASVLGGSLVGDALLRALRETCETILTVIEAIDPVSEMALENLRNKVDEQLTPVARPPAA